MADFFFFTEIDKLDIQTDANKAYGVIEDDELEFDRFNTTSLHSSQSTSKAISFCSGQTFIVADEGSPNTRVNLLIKPTEQTFSSLPNFKYIVYRGILRDSLISGSNIVPPTSNELAKSIWESQNNRNASFDKSEGNPFGTTTLPPDSSSLEVTIDVNTPSNTLIESLFINSTIEEVQRPIIKKGGWHIGDFDTVDFGIEFIVDDIGLELDLEFLQKKQHIISVPKLPTSHTQSDFFNHWNDKEKILSFLDPCAVFGSFYDNKLNVFVGGNPESKTSDKIYTDILYKFYNKNYVYVDIRNELDYSYNYFKNYTNLNTGGLSESIYINFGTPNLDVNSFAGIDYNTWGILWPIIIFDNSSYSSVGSISTQLELQLSFPKCNNPNPTLALKQGKLKQPNIYRKHRLTGSYRHVLFPGASAKSEIISVLIPNYTASANEIHLISSYVRLGYYKQTSQCINSNPDYSSTEFKNWFDLDNIFTPFDMFLPWGETPPEPELGIMDSYVYKNECYTDVMRSSGQLFIGNSGIARDSEGNITLFVFSANKLRGNRKIKETPFSLISRKQKVGNESYIKQIARQFQLDNIKIIAPDTDEPIEFIGNISTPVINNFQNYNPDDFAFLTISNENWNILKSYVDGTHSSVLSPPFLAGYKIHLGFKFISSELAPTIYNDIPTSNSIDLMKFQLVLRGFHVGAAGDIEVLEIPTEVNHYRIRRNITVDMMMRNTSNNTEDGDDNLELPSTLGKGYTVTNLGDNLTMEEPLGERFDPPNYNLESSNVKSRAISCNLYLMRGSGITPEEFCSAMEYIQENIQIVWNSNRNYALGTTYEPDIPPPGGSPNTPGEITKKGSIHRSYWIDSSDVHVLEASNRHFDTLKQNEVLWLIDLPNGGSGRSFVNADTRRTGVFFYISTRIPSGNPIIPYVDPNNTAAHEFGHVLGLTDRYSSWANVLPDNVVNRDSDDEENDKIPSGSGLNNIVSRGGKTNTYLPISTDEEYSQRYNWLHNLMSSQKEVDITIPFTPSGNLIYHEITYYCYHFPYRNIDNPSDLKISLFVTQKQLHYVVNNLVEPSTGDYCFFRHVGNDLKVSPGNGRDVFFGIYQGGGHNGNLVSSWGYEAQWYLYNQLDHKMNGRIRVNFNSNVDTIAPNRAFAHFSPFEGTNKLSPSEPAYLDAFPSIYRQSKNRDIAEIETGENSYSNRNVITNKKTVININELHCCFAGLCDMVTNIDRLTSDPSYDPRSSLNAYSSSNSCTQLASAGLLQVTNDINILQQLISLSTDKSNQVFVNDQYKNMGSGDNAGKNLWRNRTNNNNGGTYQLKNDGTMYQPNLHGSIRYKFWGFQQIYPKKDNVTTIPSPFAFHKYNVEDYYGLRARTKQIFTSAKIEYPDSGFFMESNHYYNRRRIISIINEGS